MLELCETFRSLQGEGPLMGRPAFFIRLSGCVQPFCPWCDTPEGLQPGTFIHIDQLMDRLDLQRDRLVVITGGEPFRQWDQGLHLLEEELLTRELQVQYETSGKLRLPQSTKGEIICSPKYIDHRWHFDLENLARPITAFKFVLADETEHVQAFIAEHGIARERVWIMAQGAERKQQLDRSGSLWQFCVEHGYNYSPRLHILTFDRQRSI